MLKKSARRDEQKSTSLIDAIFNGYSQANCEEKVNAGGVRTTIGPAA